MLKLAEKQNINPFVEYLMKIKKKMMCQEKKLTK